jgi:magnesium-transporting ATPase (P-type)
LIHLNSIRDDDSVLAEMKKAQSKQIFLGMTGLKHHPKKEANEMVQDLDQAGIRFVLFSEQGEHETIAFGKELGINVDFNYCVSLASEPSPYRKINLVRFFIPK